MDFCFIAIFIKNESLLIIKLVGPTQENNGNGETGKWEQSTQRQGGDLQNKVEKQGRQPP